MALLFLGRIGAGGRVETQGPGGTGDPFDPPWRPDGFVLSFFTFAAPPILHHLLHRRTESAHIGWEHVRCSGIGSEVEREEGRDGRKVDAMTYRES